MVGPRLPGVSSQSLLHAPATNGQGLRLKNRASPPTRPLSHHENKLVGVLGGAWQIVDRGIDGATAPAWATGPTFSLKNNRR